MPLNPDFWLRKTTLSNYKVLTHRFLPLATRKVRKAWCNKRVFTICSHTWRKRVAVVERQMRISVRPSHHQTSRFVPILLVVVKTYAGFQTCSTFKPQYFVQLTVGIICCTIDQSIPNFRIDLCSWESRVTEFTRLCVTKKIEPFLMTSKIRSQWGLQKGQNARKVGRKIENYVQFLCLFEFILV